MRVRHIPKSRFEFARMYCAPALGLLFWIGICVLGWATVGQSIPERLHKHRAQARAQQPDAALQSDDSEQVSVAANSPVDDEEQGPGTSASGADSLRNPPTSRKALTRTENPPLNPRQTRADEMPISGTLDGSTDSADLSDVEVVADTSGTLHSESVNSNANRVLPANVVRAQLASAVENYEPIDRVKDIFHSQGSGLRRLYYFTELQGLAGQTVTHTWWHNDRRLARVVIRVRANSFRAYSSKRLIPRMAGDWKVVMSDSEGNTLSSTTFTYEVP